MSKKRQIASVTADMPFDTTDMRSAPAPGAARGASEDGRPADDVETITKSRINGANLDASDLTPKARALVKLRTRKGKRRLLTIKHLDGRTAAAQAARHLFEAMANSLGGIAALGVGEQEHLQRAVMLGAIAADYETRWAAGHRINLRQYIMTVGAQRRSLAALGLEKRDKPEEDKSEDFYKEKLPRLARETRIEREELK